MQIDISAPPISRSKKRKQHSTGNIFPFLLISAFISLLVVTVLFHKHAGEDDRKRVSFFKEHAVKHAKDFHKKIRSHLRRKKDGSELADAASKHHDHHHHLHSNEKQLKKGDDEDDDNSKATHKKHEDSNKESVTLQTAYGHIKIQLRHDLSAESVQYIKDVFAHKDECKNCNIYRSEADLLIQGSVAAPSVPEVTKKGGCPPEFQGVKQDCPKHDPNCGCHGPTMTRGMGKREEEDFRFYVSFIGLSLCSVFRRMSF